jgi:opacity protein-like surface antigen
MKSYLMAAVVIALTAPSAYAQSSSPPNQNGARAQAQAPSGQNLAAAAQKVKQDLQNAGFTDVKVVAESFVVQAKSKDGDPVVMTIGPHGMSVFEAMNDAGKSGSGTTGSANGNSGSAGSRK